MIDDLTEDDLAYIGWSGSPLHVEQVAAAIARRRLGEVDYLVVRDSAGEPIAKGGVDYKPRPGSGTLWQLAVHADHQRHGIGTMLIAALEDRIRDRGIRRGELGVEVNNPRAQALYERLGYVVYGQQPEEWDAQDVNGNVYRYRTVENLMYRVLDRD